MKKAIKKLVLFAIAGALSLGIVVSPVHPIKSYHTPGTIVLRCLPLTDEIEN